MNMVIGMSMEITHTRTVGHKVLALNPKTEGQEYWNALKAPTSLFSILRNGELPCPLI